jgi:adenylylsulfate kinase
MAFTLWIMGLPGSGKTTISKCVYEIIKGRELKVELLDSDIVWSHFGKILKPGARDRNINERCIAFVSHLLNRNNIINVVAATSPLPETREENRKLIYNYIEVFCKCPLEVVESRDPKGLYRMARAGFVPDFTGIGKPYEEPESADIIVHTDAETVEESVTKILKFLKENKYLKK